jgi:hypothetical protein
MIPEVLCLDIGGLPRGWIPAEEAVLYYARNLVGWDLGAPVHVFRGGICARTGLRSEIAPAAIVAIRGEVHVDHWAREPLLSRATLFVRDKHMCGYCGELFKDQDLTKDHVVPQSRGGANFWTNVVTACRACNQKKDDRTPEEAHMPLLYVPYTPNRYEHLILLNRRILADQMAYLLAHVPRHSRLHA